MIKRIMILLISVILIFSSLQVSFAEPQMTRHMKYGIYMAEKNLFSGKMLLRMKDDIGLTDEQVVRIEKIREIYKENLFKSEADLKVFQLKFDSYLKEEKINRGNLENIIREMAALKTNMQIENINHLLDLRDLLTAKQLVKIDKLKEEKRSKCWDRRKDRRKDDK